MLARSIPLIIFCFLAQASSHIPPKEDLCGLLVDTVIEQECLQCFEDAGDITQNPEGVRECVGKYLPPDAAECSVPHARINQGKPNVHHNHTNANLLPNCLKRRMRELSRYLNSEIQFTKAAGRMIKAVVASNYIKDGGPTMLSAQAMLSIINIPSVKAILKDDELAQQCLEKYQDDGSCQHATTRTNNRNPSNRNIGNRNPSNRNSDNKNTRNRNRDNKNTRNRNRDNKNSDINNTHNRNSGNRNSDNKNSDNENTHNRNSDNENTHNRNSKNNKNPSNGKRNNGNGNGNGNNGNGNGNNGNGNKPSVGNKFPFSGTNCLSRISLMGQCVIDAMIETGSAKDLLDIMIQDTFFYPIPKWWVGPLLKLAKEMAAM